RVSCWTHTAANPRPPDHISLIAEECSSAPLVVARAKGEVFELGAATSLSGLCFNREPFPLFRAATGPFGKFWEAPKAIQPAEIQRFTSTFGNFAKPPVYASQAGRRRFDPGRPLSRKPLSDKGFLILDPFS